MNIPAELVKAIKEDNLVLFVGAGLSYNFIDNDGNQLGDWKNLVTKILDNVDGLDYLKPLINEHEPLKIMGLVEDKKKNNEVIEFVKEFYSLPTDKNNYDLHRKLCKLTIKIISTNYDNAFEIADPDLSTKTASFGKDYELSCLHNSNDKTLFKLHGSIFDAGKMVLFPSNYEDIYKKKSKDAERLVFYLQNLVINKTILFLGCGMGDFQINEIFLYIKEILGKYHTKKHYIIAKENKLDSKLQTFLELIPINEYSEIETVIDNLLKIKEEKDDARLIARLKERLAELDKSSKDTIDRIKFLSLKYEKEGFQQILEGNYEKSIEKAIVSTDIDPSNGNAFYMWGTALSFLANTKKDVNLFEQAIDKYKEAIQLNPDNPDNTDIIIDWGTAYSYLADMNQNESLFNKAIDKYEKVIKVKPECVEVYNNFGNTLLNMAIMKKDENLFEQALEKYRKAAELDQFGYADVYFGCGTVLYHLADMKQSEELFNQALENYEKAAHINSNYPNVFYSCGITIFSLAKMKNDETLFKQAIEKLEKAAQIDPENADVIFCLANALHFLSYMKKDAILYRQAIGKYKEATLIKSTYADTFFNITNQTIDMAIMMEQSKNPL